MRECCPWCFRQTLAAAGKTERWFPLVLIPEACLTAFLYAIHYLTNRDSRDSDWNILSDGNIRIRNEPGFADNFQKPHLPAATATLVGASTLPRLLLPPYLAVQRFIPLFLEQSMRSRISWPCCFVFRVVLHRATSAKRMTGDSNNERRRR